MGANLGRHEPSDACHGIHCYSCNFDEVGVNAYIVCGECGHVYPSARSLRRRWRRAERRMEHLRYAGWESTSLMRAGWRLAFWWSLLTVRASRIHSCAECSHDF